MAAYQQQDNIQLVPRNIPQPASTEIITTIGKSTVLLTNKTIAQPRWRCCVQSKATILILVWNLCVAIGLEFFSLPLSLSVLGNIDNIVRICVYGLFAVFLLFYPLAGYLADAHWGRYKTIFGSLRFILLSVLMIIIFFLVFLGQESLWLLL